MLLSREEVKSIAIFRALFLGDMLCIIPAVRAIKHAYPDASITLIGLPWQKEFAKRFSNYFSDFMDFPGWPGLPEQEFNAPKVLAFLQQVRERKFDLIFQMQGNGILTNSMCMLWSGKYVSGLRTAVSNVKDERFFPVSEDEDHEVLRFLKLIDALQIPGQGEDLEFPIAPEEREDFERISSQLKIVQGDYVCIHPGARDPKKRWPLENFKFIAEGLINMGNRIVLTGSWQERELLAALETKIEAPVINIVEKLNDVSLGRLATIIHNSKLLISNDTGVSHIAAGLQHPSVIIFSAFSSLKRWAPLNRGLHRVITHEKANDPEYVYYHILDHLQKHALLLNQE